MADGGTRLVAAYQNLPSNPSAARGHYLAQAPDHSYSRRKPPVASLSLHGASMASSTTTSSASPPNAVKNEFGGVGTGIAYGGLPAPAVLPPGDPNNPLNLSLIKNLADKRVTRDGQPAKRRGPKPDSKPALTRRQELNRQAQRTHRERKELYIKALEDEVLRLKEVYNTVDQDKNRLAQENQMLRTIIQQHGLNVPPRSAAMMPDDSISNQPYMADNHSPSSASYALHSATTQTTPFTPPSAALSANGAMPRGLSPPGGMSPSGLSPHSAMSVLHRPSPTTRYAPQQQQQQQQQRQQQQRNPGIDYDQAGVGFVLALERPCMDHMPWLLERSAANGGKDPCGHALMASCPPEPQPDASTGAFPPSALGPAPGGGGGHGGHHRHGRGNHLAAPAAVGPLPRASPNSSSAMDVDVDPAAAAAAAAAGDDGAPRTWELSKTGLSTLLDLSKKLNLDGEITPVMAWGMVLGHPRLGELSEKDFETLAEELTSKVRCYGFGAVMEEFEVKDALAAMFSRKPDLSVRGGGNSF